ncbi:MAG: menaquinone biosynthesis protein [Ginsengibacter sp.]
MERKIRVGAVSYLNTKPLIYGFEQGMMKDEIDLVIDYPSKIAAMLINGEITAGLVPVSIIPELEEHYIIADYCIGCDGETGSVGLFSDVPLSKIQKILLDYQSRTSVDLLKILIKEYWEIDPVIEMASGNFQQEIKGTTAGLVIGDRAFKQRQVSGYMFDLGLEWKKFTGLPFVFAAWVSNRKIEKPFIEAFNKATSAGLQHIDKIVAVNPFTLFDLKAYYTSYIRYILNEDKKKAIHFFLHKCHAKRLNEID